MTNYHVERRISARGLGFLGCGGSNHFGIMVMMKKKKKKKTASLLDPERYDAVYGDRYGWLLRG